MPLPQLARRDQLRNLKHMERTTPGSIRRFVEVNVRYGRVGRPEINANGVARSLRLLIVKQIVCYLGMHIVSELTRRLLIATLSLSFRLLALFANIELQLPATLVLPRHTPQFQRAYLGDAAVQPDRNERAARSAVGRR